MSIKFRKFLKESIEKADISIQALSRKTGVTAGYIARLIHEEHYPSPDVLRKLAKGLDVEYLDLMRKIGYIEEEISNPDLHQLILANLVSLGGIEIKGLNHAREICKVIDSALEISLPVDEF